MNQTTADTPVSANDVLPFEILSKIFLESLLPWYEPYNKKTLPDRRIEAATIRRASQVCQYWRAVALALPKLWGTIINVDFDKAPWIQELLRRSGDSPLVVQSRADLNPFYENFESQKWALLFNEMHRIRILDLTVHWSPRINYQPLEDALTLPAPLMECVRINPQRPAGARPLEPTFLDLPDRLFAAHTPKLREVITHGTGLLTTLCLRRMKLVSLSVSTERGEPFYPPSEWLLILNDQPQLRYLSLSSLDVHHDLPPMPANRSSVPLPNLEYLSLSGKHEFCDQLLPKIVLPTSCLLNLYSSRNRNIFSNANGMVQGLATYFNGWDKGMKCLAWTICVINGTQLSISAYKDEDSEPMAMASIFLTLEEAQADLVIVAIFGMLQASNLLKESVSLKFRFYHPLSPATRTALASLLGSCDQARKVILMGPCTAEVLLNTILMDDGVQPTSIDGPSNSSATRDILLPNLDTLVLNEPANEERDVSELLFNFLRWRRDFGRRIPNFSMYVRDPEKAQFMHEAHPDLEVDLDINDSEHQVANNLYRNPHSYIV